MKKCQINKGDENLWLISYSDLITSILAVLVLVMSFSKIDIEKIDHANRLMKDDSLLTLAMLQTQYKDTVKKNNLQKFVNIFLDDEGLHINMSSTVQFDLNSAKLDKKGIKVLEPIFEKIVENSHQREIVVIGHTDSSGSAKRNWELSSQRANSVLLYLIEKGLNDKHAHIIAYAANKPLKKPNGTNITAAQRNAQNRRVTILVTKSY